MPQLQSDKSVKKYLHIRFDSRNLLISTDQFEGIIEFREKNRNSDFPQFVIATIKRDSDLIPVIYLRKFLKCENHSFIPTSQSRILLLYNSKIGSLIGVVVDAIVGYHEIKLENKRKILLNDIFEKSDCYPIEFKIQVNEKFIPLLNLNKLVDEDFFDK
ncbi:MAG: chemotaxis protein CheW [Candidatus Hodarchaeales archaeon]|jgi:chemotaxis signal transduction protein